MRRLLVVSPTGLLSGAEVVLLRTLAAAVGQGTEVTCLCPEGPLGPRLRALGAKIIGMPDLKLPSGSRAMAATRLTMRNLGAALLIRRCAKQADVILINGFFALPALRLASVRPPAAWLVHDVIHRRSWLRLLRVSKAGVTLAVAVSQSVAVPLRRLAIPVEVIENGTTWPVEPISAYPSKHPIIGCAALLTPWKGHEVLLEAISQVKTPLTLELAGGEFPKDAAYVARLRARAEEPDLSGRVRFLGHVTDPLAQMRTWSVLISASVEPEAAPLNVLEAMSIGLPVVATNHGGPAEFLRGGGLLVPPGDPVALAAGVTRMLSDVAFWEGCSRAGPETITSHGLTIEIQQQRMMTCLLQMSARHPRR